MDDNRNRNSGKEQVEQQAPHQQGTNQTLNDPGAAVADYGRAEQGTGGQQAQPAEGESRRGNSSIPSDEEDTIGNP